MRIPTLVTVPSSGLARRRAGPEHLFDGRRSGRYPAHAAQDAGGRGATGGLSGARAQRERDVPPRLKVWRGARQMQHHAADRADDVDPQLQQPVAQPRHLAAGTRSTRRPQSQLLHEHVGRGRQEDAHLVRPEPTAARAVDLQPIEQFLDL